MSKSSEEAQNWQMQQRRMLIAMREMRGKLDTLEKNQTEPIAIVGMGCRFPGGANSPEAFWQLLHDRVDAVAEVPPERWNINEYYDPNPDAPEKMYTRQGGFLQQPLTAFASEFFGISAQQAECMNPQQLLLMEVVWEALEHAGAATERLKGSKTGLFVGISTNEFDQQLQSIDPTEIDPDTILGNNQSITVGRIAFLLGLQGPTFQLDAACASSLLSVHLACQSLRARECDMALSGGVNLILSPAASIYLCKIKALSPDGRCKTFDAAADGYGRAEGCGMVVLKRLSDAISAQDNILALIRGSAVNHNGASSGLTTPNPQAQQSLMQNALVNAKVDPLQVSYIEAQGTGTSLGDAMEVNALAKVYGKARPKNQPLWVGSAKTNIGHLEAAAGVAALIKVVLQMQHQEISAHLHLQELNPKVAWDQLPVSVPTSHQPWTGQQRLAGVSAFGFSGTNVHLIVEEAPLSNAEESVPTERPLHLLTLSAKTPQALQQLCDSYSQQLSSDSRFTLEDICFTANTGREHFPHRLSVVAATVAELQQKLAALSNTAAAPGVYRAEVTQTQSPKVIFLFGDEPSKLVGVARQLYETNPKFKGVIEQCHQILQTHFEHSLMDVLYPQDNQSTASVDKARTQPAVFALEYALAQLWRSWGVEPNGVMGQGVGEYVAACVAGVFSLEDGLKLMVARSRESIPAEVEPIVQQLSYSKPQINIIANTTTSVSLAQLATPQYWMERLREPVQPTLSLDKLQAKYEIAVVIELEPKLLTLAQQDLTNLPKRWMSSLDGSASDWQTLLESLAQLYVEGVSVDWLGFDRDYRRQKVVLPTYPFERPKPTDVSQKSKPRRSAWVSNPGIAIGGDHPLLTQRLNIAGIEQICFQSQIAQHQPAYLKDYRIFQRAIAPASLYIEMALAAAQEIYSSDALILEELVIESGISLPDYQPVTVQVVLSAETNNCSCFKIFACHSSAETTEPDWKLHASGKVLLAAEIPTTASRDLSSLQTFCSQVVDIQQYYQHIQQHQINYGSSFQALEQLWHGEGKALGKIQLPAEVLTQAEDYILHPIVLDAAFQQFWAALGNNNQSETYLPLGLKRLRIYQNAGRHVWSHIQINSSVKDQETQSISADLSLMDETGNIIAEVEALRLKSLSYQDLFDEELPSSVLKTPTEIYPEIQPKCSALMAEPELINYWKKLPHLEALSIDYVLQAFEEMNWKFQVGQQFITTEFSQQLGIVNQHDRLFNHLLVMLAEVGILEQNNNQWRVLKTPEKTDPQEQYDALSAQYPSLQIELKLLHRCGASLAQVLQGSLNPLQLLFPEGDTTTAQLYEKSPELKAMNTLVQQAVLSAIADFPATTAVKILEVGAGTGGTTTYLLPHLAPQATEYIYTDIGRLLINQAQEKFKDYSFVSYQTLNIELDPSTQGFNRHQSDLIVAANVLHATKDLRQTLKHIQQLLKPGGLLILLEGIQRQRWLDLIFGLTPGWWRFTDTDLRSDHALLSADSWQKLLLESGFIEGVTMPVADEIQSHSSVQSIFIARGGL